jgi:hypothetical protein
MSDFSLSTFLTSAVLTVGAAILAYRGARKSAQQDLRAAEELAAMDDYSSALRSAADACSRCGGALRGPGETNESILSDANRRICELEMVVDKVAMRLPADVRAAARDTAGRCTHMSATIIGGYSPDENVSSLLMKTSTFGTDLREQRREVEGARAEMLGH